MRTSEGQLEGDDQDVFFLRVLFREDIQVFTNWITCSEEEITELPSSQVVLNSLLIVFLDE